jgi:hypothetical protein
MLVLETKTPLTFFLSYNNTAEDALNLMSAKKMVTINCRRRNV